jgi:hypothetical protein
MENNIEFLLKNKQTIELLLLKSNKKYDDYLINNSPFESKKCMVELKDVNDILYDDYYESGIYGFLNYQLNLKYDEMLKKNYEFLNKPSIVKKLIDTNNFELTNEATEQNYGILELYEKVVFTPRSKNLGDDISIVELKKYYLLKNSDINIVNESSYDTINIKLLPSDFIVTKIYKLDNKPKLLNVMTKQDYIVEQNNDIFIKYDKMIKQMCVDNKKMLNYMLNFDNIYKLCKLNDCLENDNFNLSDLLEFDFSKYIDDIKTTNNYDMQEYNELIEKYYGLTLDDLFDEINEKYIIMEKTKPAIKIVLELMIRIFIDIKLNNKKFNLSKSILKYLPSSKEIDPYVNLKSQILIDRHWRNLLAYDEITIEFNNFNIKPMVLSVFQMLKKHNLNHILNYLKEIVEKNDKIVNI